MSKLNRRQMLGTAAAVSGALAAGQASGEQAVEEIKVGKRIRRVAKNGNIRHSIVAWCFQDYWSPDELIPIAKEMGCVSVELMEPKFYPDLKKHGLECAIAGSILVALRLVGLIILSITIW